MVKYNGIWKSTLREIRDSFGRFAAIMAIVALGVGLFAGLKVTRTAMMDRVQDYFEELDFYDYRLLSNYGFDEEAVEFLEEKLLEEGFPKESEDVEAVEGVLSFDVLYQDQAGEEGVVKIYSLPEKVNGVVVVEGRMPAQPDECLADSSLFGSDAIGSRVVLSERNEKETLEHFARREYTIVGRAQSSLYIQFERGNTSLGTGRIDGFLYLPREGFAEDYYTELYVKFREDMPLYSDAYEDFLKEKDGVWEELAAQAAQNRFHRLKAGAQEEYDKALAEFEEEKEDAGQELESARLELVDAAAQIEDGERELADAAAQLEDGRRELAEAERTLADKEKELAEGEQELAQAREEWEFQNHRVEEAKEDLRAGEEALPAQEALLTQKEQELAAGEAALQAALAGAGIPDIETVYQTLEQLVTSGGPQAQIAQLQGLIGIYEGLQEGRAALQEAQSQLGAFRAQIQSGYGELESADRELGRAWQEMEEAAREIEEGKEALAEGARELQEGRAELADAAEELAEGEKELEEARQEYADGVKEYEEGLAEYEEEVAQAQGELGDAWEEIQGMEPPEAYVLGRDTNVGYVCFESDSNIVDGIANVFPVFFFLVAALVCVTTMNRMVEEQRTQIGVLKALGYSEAAIMMKYVFYSGSAAVLGCLLGFFGGTYLFPKVIWTAYCIMYSVGDIRYVLAPGLGVFSAVGALLCSVGATWLSCRMELFQVPAGLMRPKAPKAGKRVFLERLPFLWKRLSFLRKVSVRNIFRYKKRLFMMVLGIGGCTALLVTGFGIHDSIAEVGNQQFQEIQIYDLAVTFSEELDEEMERELARAAGKETGESMIEGQVRLLEQSMDLVTDTARKSAYVVVFPEDAEVSPFLDLHSPKGGKIDYPGPGGAVLSRRLAEDLDIGIGDGIVLENGDLRVIEATVEGICENFIYDYVYLGEAAYRDGMGEPPEYKSLYINAAPEADVHLLSAALMGVEGVANVTVNEDVLLRFNRMMKSLDLIVAVVILCAALLAFIVLYNLTNINITERVREIATIKVLGFYKRETASYVFRENTVLTLFGALPGLLLGKWLHSFVMSQIKVNMVAFDVRILPQSYFYSLVFTFLFSWFVNRVMRGKLEGISMTESLKSVD